MKYLLDESEYKALVPQSKVDRLTEALKVARVRILKAASFRCVHDEDGSSCCDDCPAGGDVFSDEFEAGEPICGLERRYSQ